MQASKQAKEQPAPGHGLYLLLLSVHGLIRGTDPELGRDADTGGQVTYVLELARALARHPRVARVDLVTRQVHDRRIDDGYAEPFEDLAPGSRIVRLPCGPRRYIRKELLWPHLPEMADHLLGYLRGEGRMPDVIHGHYADAADVGSTVAAVLGVPFVFTGHSLGREKLRRLRDRGLAEQTIEEKYRISLRIEAEETALDYASFVVASTNQEIEKQYALYDDYDPERMKVMPPGIDEQRFHPCEEGDEGFHRDDTDPHPFARELARFLDDPRKPMVLAVARPDPKKNLATLIRAFGEHPELRSRANLVILAGCRNDLREADREAQNVWTELLYRIDLHDLYGHVAYPKKHAPEDVPALYRAAARTRGVFVNPALTEPFGLTLLEAAASGLPIIATNDGGPREIVDNCDNGILVDPLDASALAEAILGTLSDSEAWEQRSRSGIAGVQEHYTWTSHVERYVAAVRDIELVPAPPSPGDPRKLLPNRLITMERIVVCDIDDTLIGGDREGLDRLLEALDRAGPRVGFGVATGRSRDLALQALAEWSVPTPEFVLASVGTEIYYGQGLVEDQGWKRHLRYRWSPDTVREALDSLPGLELQGPEGQRPYKVSYFIDPDRAPAEEEIRTHLRKRKIHVKAIFSHDRYLDLIPIRASKGLAVRYCAMRWDIPVENVLVAGDSGNDIEMLTGATLGIVVGNHRPEVAALRDHPGIYFSRSSHARGVLEGIEHYGFLEDAEGDGQESEGRSEVARV